jgi:hypothetical protein
MRRSIYRESRRRARRRENNATTLILISFVLVITVGILTAAVAGAVLTLWAVGCALYALLDPRDFRFRFMSTYQPMWLRIRSAFDWLTT